jgi:hypothetical protein
MEARGAQYASSHDSACSVLKEMVQRPQNVEHTLANCMEVSMLQKNDDVQDIAAFQNSELSAYLVSQNPDFHDQPYTSRSPQGCLRTAKTR